MAATPVPDELAFLGDVHPKTSDPVLILSCNGKAAWDLFGEMQSDGCRERAICQQDEGDRRGLEPGGRRQAGFEPWPAGVGLEDWHPARLAGGLLFWLRWLLYVCTLRRQPCPTPQLAAYSFLLPPHAVMYGTACRTDGHKK